MTTTTLSTWDRLFSRAFWEAEFPQLSIGDSTRPPLSNGPEPERLAINRERMILEGYFQESSDYLSSAAPRLASAVVKLHQRGLPPPFLFLFDEPWAAFYALHGQLMDTLGTDYIILPDFWVWYIEPNEDGAGWTPHRDRNYRILREDRSPSSATVWIPLSEANPLNSCMYIVPANRDPTYGTPEDQSFQIEPASVRALPAQPGDYFCWNQAVLHWGSRASRFAASPRISMALEFQRGGMTPYNTPALPSLIHLTFEQRLKLVAKQILQYRHMYPLTANLAALAERIMAQPGGGVG